MKREELKRLQDELSETRPVKKRWLLLGLVVILALCASVCFNTRRADAMAKDALHDVPEARP